MTVVVFGDIEWGWK